KTLPRILPALCLLLALPALAQRPPRGNTRRTPRTNIEMPAAPPTGNAPADLPTTQTQPAQVNQGSSQVAPSAQAQNRPAPPVSTRPQTSRGTTQNGETTLRPKPTCEQVRRNAKFNIFLKGVAIE